MASTPPCSHAAPPFLLTNEKKNTVSINSSLLLLLLQINKNQTVNKKSTVCLFKRIEHYKNMTTPLTL